MFYKSQGERKKERKFSPLYDMFYVFFKIKKSESKLPKINGKENM